MNKVTFCSWILFLVGIKCAAAWLPHDRDTRQLAEALDVLGVQPSTTIIAVDTKRNALPIYGYPNLEWVLLHNRPYPYFSAQRSLSAVIAERHDVNRSILVSDPSRVPAILSTVEKVSGSICGVIDHQINTHIVACGELLAALSRTEATHHESAPNTR